MTNSTIRDVYEEGYAVAAGLCAAPIRWSESSICPGGLIDGVQLASTVVPYRRAASPLTVVEFLTVMEEDLVSTENQEVIQNGASSNRELTEAIIAAAEHALLHNVAAEVDVQLLGTPTHGIIGERSSAGLGAGAIAGITVSVLLGLGVVIVGVMFWRRRKSRENYEDGYYNPRPFCSISNQDDFRL